MIVFLRQIYSYGFYISKLSKLKVIHDLYSQCLTQTLFKTTFFIGTEGVHFSGLMVVVLFCDAIVHSNFLIVLDVFTFK